MRTAYKVRAYPEAEQEALYARTFGCIRVVWNRTLAARQVSYSTLGEGMSYAQTDAALTAMKRTSEFGWLAEVSSVPLQQTLRHQYKAFQAFFGKRAKYPRFKSRNGRQSATYTRSAFRMKGADLWLAKDNRPLRIVWSWPDIDLATLNPTTVTLSRDTADRYFVSFAVDTADIEPLPATGESIGVDLGLKDFAVLSDGERIAHPRHMDTHERRLKRYQRILARKQRGSQNRKKAKRKVARQHVKVADARRDFLHKTSTDLVRRFDLIAVEDLAVANMMKNRSLAKSISRTGWGEFRSMLAYKSERHSRTLTVIDRWYPSSKTCSSCGHLLATLSLRTRQWTCPGCGTLLDRDVNAAKNILAAGLVVARESEACGDGVSRQGSSLPLSLMNQETHPVRDGIPRL